VIKLTRWSVQTTYTLVCDTCCEQGDMATAGWRYNVELFAQPPKHRDYCPMCVAAMVACGEAVLTNPNGDPEET